MVFAFLKSDNSALFSVLKKQGFKAISDKNWQTLMDAIALLDSHQLTHFTVRQKIKALGEQAVKEKTLDAIKDFSQLNQCILPMHINWQKQKIALFNDAQWWEGRLEAAKALAPSAREKALQTIPLLKQLWDQQSHYARYSTPDLIYVYESIFGLFREWLLYARAELNQKTRYLPEATFVSYNHYLAQVAKSLAEEEQQIRMACKARLVAGLTQQNPQFEDVISLMQKELHALGVLSPPEDVPQPKNAGYMTPDVFVKMHQIIEQNATEDEKTDWYSLAYNAHRHSNDPLFNRYYRSTHQGYTYRIPAALDKQLPKKLPGYFDLPWFLHWLFVADQCVHTFFQHATCQYLLAVEQSFTVWRCPQTIDLCDLEKHTAWQGLQQLWVYLAAEKARTQTTQKNLFVFSRSKITPLLEGYHVHLHQLAHEILRKQIAMVNRAIEPFKQNVMRDAEKKQLECLLQGLQETAKSWKGSAELSDQLSMLTLHCHHLLHRPIVTTEILNRANVAIEQLNRGEKITSKALNAIKVTQESLALEQVVVDADSYKKSIFTRESTLARHKVPDLLKATLLEKPLGYDQAALSEHLKKLTTYATWAVREEPPLMDPVVLNDQLGYYTYAFLQSMAALSSKEAYLAKADTIHRVMGVLQDLTQTRFPALHRILSSADKMNPHRPFYANNWTLFSTFELSPFVNMLKNYLIARGLDDNLGNEKKNTAKTCQKNSHV